jgi:hypothetical protein
VLIVGVAYRRFLIALPITTRWLFAMAAALYVGGALGIEMLRGTTYPYNPSSLTYIMGGLCEEGLEMLGLVIFVYALCSYLASEIGEMRIVFKKEVTEGFFATAQAGRERYRYSRCPTTLCQPRTRTIPRSLLQAFVLK